MIGNKVQITGLIIEELKFGNQEWFTIKIDDSHQLTLQKKLCTLIKVDSWITHNTALIGKQCNCHHKYDDHFDANKKYIGCTYCPCIQFRNT